MCVLCVYTIEHCTGGTEVQNVVVAAVESNLNIQTSKQTKNKKRNMSAVAYEENLWCILVVIINL